MGQRIPDPREDDQNRVGERSGRIVGHPVLRRSSPRLSAGGLTEESRADGFFRTHCYTVDALERAFSVSAKNILVALSGNRPPNLVI
jgi:hypothetical protein